jgi:hypothetical protein
MTKEEKKEYLDLLSKQSDVINKKAIILLAVSGGIGAYAIKFLFDSMNDMLGYLFGIVFVISALGVFINYSKLHKIEMKMEDLENV